MDVRHYVNLINADREAREREAWMELHRRPDALPLPPEVAVPWSQRVIGLRWLVRATAAARRRLFVGSRARRSGDEALSR